MLKDAGDVVAGYVFDRLWVVVEGGDYGEDGGASFCGGSHVADMDEVERGFADAEDERAAFLEADVGGSLDEVLREAVSDAGEGSHGTGKDDHAVGGIGAAGDGCADVFVGELPDFCRGAAEELFNERVAAVDGGLLCKHAESAGGDDEIDVGDTVVGFKGEEHFAGEECPAGSGDGKC